MKRLFLFCFVAAGVAWGEEIDAEIVKELDFFENVDLIENLDVVEKIDQEPEHEETPAPETERRKPFRNK